MSANFSQLATTLRYIEQLRLCGFGLEDVALAKEVIAIMRDTRDD